MKLHFTLFLTIIIFITISCINQSVVIVEPKEIHSDIPEKSKYITKPGNFYYKIGNECYFYVHYQSPNVYLYKNLPYITLYDFLDIFYIDQMGKINNPIGGYFNINDNPAKINYISSNPEVLEIERNVQLSKNWVGDIFTFKSEGDISIDFHIDNIKFSIPIQVHKLEFGYNDLTEKIIEVYGFPSKITKLNGTSWPNSKKIDCIFYSPTASESSIYTDHWFYDSLPNLVIAVIENKLYKIECCVFNQEF